MLIANNSAWLEDLDSEKDEIANGCRVHMWVRYKYTKATISVNEAVVLVIVLTVRSESAHFD